MGAARQRSIVRQARALIAELPSGFGKKIETDHASGSLATRYSRPDSEGIFERQEEVAQAEIDLDQDEPDLGPMTAGDGVRNRTALGCWQKNELEVPESGRRALVPLEGVDMQARTWSN